MRILDFGFWILDSSGRPSTAQAPASQAPSARRAFTLVELLVVIAIIGALAALIVGLTAPAGVAKVTNRVKVELEQIRSAIESYHKKYGFYPPDNTNDFSKPPLYYELTGENPATPQIASQMGIAGTANFEGKNFHPNLKPSGYGEDSSTGAKYLIVPYGAPPRGLNRWHYRSSRPDHNTETYDLWAEVTVSGKNFTIGNWKD